MWVKKAERSDLLPRGQEIPKPTQERELAVRAEDRSAVMKPTKSNQLIA